MPIRSGTKHGIAMADDLCGQIRQVRVVGAAVAERAPTQHDVDCRVIARVEFLEVEAGWLADEQTDADIGARGAGRREQRCYYEVSHRTMMNQLRRELSDAQTCVGSHACRRW